MSFRARAVVLKRMRVGDGDILARLYGTGGMMDVLVRDGFRVSCAFSGLFEPFNLLELELSQMGSVLLPEDVLGVERLSFYCRDYRRYRWMCWVSLFALRHMRFYDEKLLSLLVGALRTDPKRREGVLRVRFKLEFLILSGFKPKFLGEEVGRGTLKVRLSDGGVGEDGEVEVEGSVLRALVRLHSGEGRVRYSGRALAKMDELLEKLIEYHTK
ncbi:MAG TPA: hypothetical protein EYH49_03660 [Aquifex aeolicus]|nr:hypothetical protein [Aquifex aeolicus]